jgi:hypothetical protein
LRDRKGQISNNGFPKPCRLTPVWKHRLEADQPFPDATPAGKSISNQYIRQSCKKTYWHDHLIGYCDDEYINELGNTSVQDLRLRIDPSTD